MPVDYHAWTHRPKEEGGTDPVPGLRWPWITLVNGGQILPGDGAYRESLMTEAYWDSSLTPDPTVAGGTDIYRIDDVSDGEGNTFWQLQLRREGWYTLELVHVIDETSDGGAGIYFQQSIPQASGAPFVSDHELGRAAPWPATGAEIAVSARVETYRTIWAANGNTPRIYEPRIRQNTTLDKTVGGHLKVWYRGGVGGSTDNANWDSAVIP